MKFRSKKPLISIVIVSYNMARELPRTVKSLLPPYQQEILDDEIEIIVMENGSSKPVEQTIIDSWPENVRYVLLKDPHPSPAKALNEGVKMSRGKWVCPVIDGARLASSGILKKAKQIMSIYENPIITTIGYHIGDMIQQLNVKNGYDQIREDELLSNINWPNEPDKLFKISCLAGSSKRFWIDGLNESNILIMKKTFYEFIGGYDEKFNIPGGGLVNLDFFKRCVDHAKTQYVVLLGEGSFHQFHGGVTTSRPVSEKSLDKPTLTVWEEYAEQYRQIRGESFKHTKYWPILFGEYTLEVSNEMDRMFRKSLGH